MKLFLLSFFILITISCSKTYYYAYERHDTYSYCTIEHNTRKKQIIYRGYSYEYAFSGIGYVYISCEASTTNKNNLIFTSPLDIFYTREGSRIDNFKYIPGTVLFREDKFPPGSSIGYTEKHRKDTLELHLYNDSLFKVEPSLEQAHITWMPPYMVRVKKIDYSKFPKNVQHLDLKNPERTYSGKPSK